jgi:hypothetical protein
MLEDIKVEAGVFGCYKDLMPRQPKEKRSELVGVMVTPSVKEFFETIGSRDSRSVSTVGWLFMLKGIEAYLGGENLQLKGPLILPNATEITPPDEENSQADEKRA